VTGCLTPDQAVRAEEKDFNFLSSFNVQTFHDEIDCCHNALSIIGADKNYQTFCWMIKLVEIALLCSIRTGLHKVRLSRVCHDQLSTSVKLMHGQKQGFAPAESVSTNDAKQFLRKVLGVLYAEARW
jgi:hypothetical protein